MKDNTWYARESSLIVVCKRRIRPLVAMAEDVRRLVGIPALAVEERPNCEINDLDCLQPSPSIEIGGNVQ